ncbi:MAG: molybdopterin-synthase adenylyltransferase MoeB [bacterium]
MQPTRDQFIRYSRQLILPEVQWQGQQRILEASVLLVGLGGLGSPQALYLAAAGVGTLGLLDGDLVDLTNLHRQIIHATTEVGNPKVDSAERRILAINPEVKVRKHRLRIGSENALEILAGYDVIVDCTDNFPARYLLNDACVMLGKPLVHGAIYRFEGQATVFHPARGGPCYRCLFPAPPPPDAVPTCAEAGVMGVLPGLIGMIQASEVMKLILGKGKLLIGRLLFCDALAMSFQEIGIRRDPKCPACGERPAIRELIDYELFCGLRPPAGTPPEAAGGESVQALRVVDLGRMLEKGEPVVFLDVRDDWERALYPLAQGVQIPLGELKSRWESLKAYQQRPIVVCCLFGVKSRHAVRFLRSKGFDRVWNLQGGLEEWSVYREQNPCLP